MSRSGAIAELTEGHISKQRLRAWIRLLKVSRRVEAELRNRLRDAHDTTLPRFDVLAALYRDQAGLRMSELSEALMVSNGNVTGIVDRLAEEGLLVRGPVEGDRRATLVRLTGKGRQSFARLAAEHERWVDELLAGLDARETAQLLRLVARLAGHLQTRERTP
jgi:DNA-binding MarR family transcriptional regulator